MSRENALLACLCILTMGVEAGAGAQEAQRMTGQRGGWDSSLSCLTTALCSL